MEQLPTASAVRACIRNLQKFWLRKCANVFQSPQMVARTVGGEISRIRMWNRLAVEAGEIDAAGIQSDRRDQLIDGRVLGMRDRYAVADAGRTQLLRFMMAATMLCSSLA